MLFPRVFSDDGCLPVALDLGVWRGHSLRDLVVPDSVHPDNISRLGIGDEGNPLDTVISGDAIPIRTFLGDSRDAPLDTWMASQFAVRDTVAEAYTAVRSDSFINVVGPCLVKTWHAIGDTSGNECVAWLQTSVTFRAGRRMNVAFTIEPHFPETDPSAFRSAVPLDVVAALAAALSMEQELLCDRINAGRGSKRLPLGGGLGVVRCSASAVRTLELHGRADSADAYGPWHDVVQDVMSAFADSVVATSIGMAGTWGSVAEFEALSATASSHGFSSFATLLATTAAMELDGRAADASGGLRCTPVAGWAYPREAGQMKYEQRTTLIRAVGTSAVGGADGRLWAVSFPVDVDRWRAELCDGYGCTSEPELLSSLIRRST